MQAVWVTRIERNVDRAASALFALACGYCANLWFSADLKQPMLAVAALAATAFAFLLSIRALGAVEPDSKKVPVPIFDVREVEPMESQEFCLSVEAGYEEEAELLLTNPFEPDGPSTEPLLLDDILAEIEPDSRVVRLFDPAAMPTAGELRSRIDLHLESGLSAAQSNEAAQALHDALAELRRSLR